MEDRAEPVLGYNGEPSFLSILTAVFILFVTLVIFAIWRRRKSIGHSILLTGLSDAGKTLIYTQLLCSKYVKTYTSVKENMGDIIIDNNSLKVIDIPGHERLRYKFFDKYKSSAKGIVYVIDSVTFQKDIRDVAEFLYSLLSEIADKSVPVIVLCNKQDQAMAKGSSVIKTLLEKEMNLLRLTKMSQLEATDSSSTNLYLGKQGKDFEFSHLNIKVDFAEASALDKNPNTPANMEELSMWLHKIA